MIEIHPLFKTLGQLWDETETVWKKVRRNPDPKGIHNLRVCLRRITAALSLLDSALEDEASGKVSKQVRKIRKRLGPLRNDQVQISETKKWRDLKAIKGFRRSLKRDAARKASRIHGLLNRSQRKKIREKLTRIRERTAPALWTMPLAVVSDRIRRALERQENGFQDKMGRCNTPDMAVIHDLRITGRKYRYALESAESILNEDFQNKLHPLEKCQQDLGAIRDVQLLEERLRNWGRKQNRETRRQITNRCEKLSERHTVLVNQFLKLKRTEQPLESSKIQVPAAEA